MKLNKKHVVFISVLALFLSLSTVNAANVTANQTFNNSYTNPGQAHSDIKVSTVGTASRNVKEIKITDTSYSSYFNVYTGCILPSADIISGDTLRIGNVTDNAFTIDRKLTITTICNGDQITNGVIHLIAGSDGSIVTGLKIINDKTVYTVNGISSVTLNGIWLTNSNYNTISYNSVKVADAYKVFAMPMGWSSYNTIIYNSLISTWSSCMPMGQCHYNNISNNYIQATNANLIYYNPYGHADYGGSPLCVGNYISNNYLYSIYMSDLVIAMQFTYEAHDNTTIINNTFAHVWEGINLVGDNSLITGNHFINALYSHAISAKGNNVTISDNVINVKSVLIGISVQGTSKNPNNTVKNNNITFTDGCNYAIYTDPNFRVYNNTINLPTYGKGIVGSGSIFNNIIKANKDVGIEINGGNSVVTGNKITTQSYGIHVISLTTRIYANFIGNNTITSSLYGIYLEGLIYNTTISGNMINTLASKGIYKNTTDDFGDDSSDNTINGIINDATAIIVDDSNYYTYFNKDGYLKFTSFKNDPVIILTHLTDKQLKFNQKVILTSNSMPNLLNNVIITMYPDSSGSVIKDLNFYNINLNGIILKAGTDNVNITRNNITIISDSKFTGSLSSISTNGACEFVNITNNNILMKTDQGYVYGINSGAYDPETSQYATDFSKYFTISQNNIILLGNKLSEGIYTDSLIYTNITSNTINIKGGAYAYGIATANIMGALHDLNITNNMIVANVNGMAYLIELHMSNNVLLMNNSLEGTGNGVYGICAYKTNTVTIKSNKITTHGGDLRLTDPKNYDVLGNGNAAIFLTANANTTNILLNTIYTNAVKQMIFNYSLNTVLARNSYVIDDGNLLNYFNSTINGELLKDGIILANDTLMFTDSNRYASLILETPLNLTSYIGFNSINSSFTLKSGASNSTISNLIFNLTDQTAITLVDAVGVQIKNNTINVLNVTSSGVNGILITLNSISNQIVNNLINMNGKNSLYAINITNKYQNRIGRSPKSNYISNNTLQIKSNSSAVGLYVSMADNTQISNNNINLSSNKVYGIITEYSASSIGFGTIPTNNTHITGNTINGTGSLICLIESRGAYNNEVRGNTLYSSSNTSFGYNGIKSSGDLITNNTILLTGSARINGNSIATGQTGVYYSEGSIGNRVTDNYIISSYHPGGDYAVFIATSSPSFNEVDGNYLISDNGNKMANDAVYALFDLVENNTPSYVYVSPTGSDKYGNGSQNNPYNSIAKAIEQAKNRAVIYLLNGTYHESGLIINKTLTISILNGKVLIDGNKNQIFYISNTGDLTLNGLNMTNAHAENGSVLINYGNLNIKNSDLSNNKAVKEGGAILNYGNLSIIKSVLNNNNADNGGSISNYGYAYFDGCTMNYNSALNGGAIFNNATANLNILNSVFLNNSATNNGGVVNNFGKLQLKNSILYFNNATYGGVISNSANYDNPLFGTAENTILNSTFNYNNAYNGGAIFGGTNKFTISNSTFSHNEASNSGGAISQTVGSAIIDRSKFIKNTAVSAGALGLSGDVKITNSVISNNNAMYYAGIYYEGEVVWDHIIHYLIMNNCDVENNIAMVRGGAFGFADANVNITNSNIVNNFAPTYSTVFAQNYNTNIYAVGNWWGSVYGPDDSVWNAVQYFRTWLGKRVDWGSDGTGNSTGGSDTPGGSTTPGGSGNGIGTGTGNGWGVGTGTGLGSGTGSGIGNGNGSGINGGSGSGSGTGSNSNGTDIWGKGQTANNYVNSALNTVGSVVTAAAAGSSDAGGQSGGGSGSGSKQKSYEIKQNDNSQNSETNTISGLIALLLFLIVVLAGYIHNSRKSNKP